MKHKSKILSANPARLQLAARVLLALMMHALFIVTTHHHPIKVMEAKSRTPIVSQDRHTPDQHLPHSSDDFHCATCSVQRGLASQHSAPIFAFDLSLQTASWEITHGEPCSTGAFLSLADRAPPLA